MATDSGNRAQPRLSLTTNHPPEPEHLQCPRCDSTNTKFCYYNNYNLSQPRHFCKSCRRYWTRGGALRNIPVGGNSRKSTGNKRSRTSTTATDTSSSSFPLEPVLDKDETLSFGVDVNLNDVALESKSRGFGSGISSTDFGAFWQMEGVGSREGEAGSGATWPVGGVQIAEGESFVWPDLAISTLEWGPT